MNNSHFKITSIKKRRKHLFAAQIIPPIPEDVFCEKDKTGLPVFDLSLWEEGIVFEGMTLDYDDLADLIKESFCRKAKSRALWYLSSADHSAKGLYRKLLRYFPDYAAEAAVARMEELGYIDDEKYARNTAATLAERGLSARAIVSKLIANGVAKETAKHIADRQDIDPLEQINQLIERKYSGKLSNEDDIRRTINALLRRGFAFSDIKRSIKKYTDRDFDEEC